MTKRSGWATSLSILLIALLTVAGCSPSVTTGHGVATVDDRSMKDFEGAQTLESFPSWQAVSQGWNDDLRMAFWFTPQGSRLMPYKWFVHLEQVNSRELFRSSENMNRYGYIDGPKDKFWNPDQLPLGFANSPSPDGGFVGPTCAACHSNLMVYDGKALFIDGAPSLTDLQHFNIAVVRALEATAFPPENDKAKFSRFAKAVLGTAYSDATAKTLSNRLQEQIINLARRNQLNYCEAPRPGKKSFCDLDEHANLKSPYGLGRLDAVGALFNQAAVTSADAEENWKIADAPVSFPFLWGTSQSSVVQWNGFADNHGIIGIGPLGRNAGEVVGVFGAIEVDPEGPAVEKYLATGAPQGTLITATDARPAILGYRSSLMPGNLGVLEHWVHKLRSPVWPENMLPKIDRAKAEKGKAIYLGKTDTGVSCVGCHQYVPRDEQGKGYVANLIPVEEIGTDPAMSTNFGMTINPRTNKPWASGKLEGTRLQLIAGDRYGPDLGGSRANALITVTFGALLGDKPGTIKGAYWSTSDAPKGPVNGHNYKARPLTGIWATAPYLHNGSVPSLWDLLHPADEAEHKKACGPRGAGEKAIYRPVRFHVGSRQFDPVDVGFSTAKTTHSRELDTTMPGSWNKGHAGKKQGICLSDDDKRALVEFLKTL